MEKQYLSDLNAQKASFDGALELLKPQLIAFIFADWGVATVDSKVALGGIFDRIFIMPGESPPPSTFNIFIKLQRAYEENINILFYFPDGELAGELMLTAPENYLATENEPAYLQAVVRVTFKLDRVGTHWFDVQYRKESLGLIPLLVQYAESENGNENEAL